MSASVLAILIGMCGGAMCFWIGYVRGRIAERKRYEWVYADVTDLYKEYQGTVRDLTERRESMGRT